jgi:capsular polysaccharide biosynthesis protein
MIPDALIQYGRILRTRWRWVAWGVVAALALTAAVLIAWPPQYRTQATVFVRTPGDVSQVMDGGDLYAQTRAETYAVLARSTGLASRVIADLGLGTSPEKLTSRISARPIGRTALFEVTVSAPTAEESRRAAEVLLAELSSQVDSLEAVPGALIPRAQLVVVDQPGDPRRVVAWGAPLYLVMIGALLAGAVLGATAAVLREIFTKPVDVEREDA